MQDIEPRDDKPKTETEKITVDEQSLAPAPRSDAAPPDDEETPELITLTSKQALLLLCIMVVMTVAGLVAGFASGIYYERAHHRDTVVAPITEGEAKPTTTPPITVPVKEEVSQQATLTLSPVSTPTAGPTALPEPTFTPVFTATGTLSPEPSPDLTLPPTPSPTAMPVRSFFEGPILYGHSVMGRPLYAYRLGFGESARAIIGGIHGGYEWNTIELVSATLEHFRTYTMEIPTNVTLYLIPNMNPDGYAAGTSAEVGRMNGNLVDLNRNWDYQWQMTATHGTRPVKAGTAPFSEPETAATRDFILAHNIELAVFYHSAMGVVFSGADRENSATFELTQMLSQVTGYPHQTEGIYGQITTGDAIDYLSTIGIAATEIELTTHDRVSEQEWQRNLAGMRAFLNWTIPEVNRASSEEAVIEGDWTYESYIVQTGDGLLAIAEQYDIAMGSARYEELLRVNNIKENDVIHAGAELKIPMRTN